jgi:Xaa-Pro aminopeptidase
LIVAAKRTTIPAMDTTSNLSRCAERRHALQQRMGKGIAFIPTAPVRIRNRDSDYLYRFDSYFYYLTGFPEPDAALIVLAGEEPRSMLFCRQRNPERELWDGGRHGPEGAKAQFGLDEAHPMEALDEHMPKLLANQPALCYAPGADALWDARVMGWLNEVRSQSRAGITAPAEIRDVRTDLDEMRLIKDDGELAVMRRAAANSAAPTSARCARRAPGATNTRSRRNSSTSFAVAALSFPLTGRSSPRAPTPASCITATTMPGSPTGTCC